VPILPLPQFEADLAADRRERLIASLESRGHERGSLEGLGFEDLERLERKKAPTTLVVRYGATMMIGEFPYGGDMTPGCGSKVVVRTHRGVEIGDLLTATCPNSGCSSSVSRQQMLDYIENSGGRQYPFSRDGRVLRIATREDLDAQAKLEQSRHGLKLGARAVSESMGLAMKIVDAEPILGGERITFYYTSEDRVDFRELVRELSVMHRCRIDMRQVGARDEARLTADYEKCGQYCCCKNFLKVLKPVNMRSAKVQKATLDPVKISGRCGRLMCCLRYEDETYEDLARRLPRRKAKVGTPDGDGLVLSTQILTQLVLVMLDSNGETQAYPIEEIGAPGERPASSGPARQPVGKARRERPAPAKSGTRESAPEAAREGGRDRGREPPREGGRAAPRVDVADAAREGTGEAGGESGSRRKRKRRRRRRTDEGVAQPGSPGSGDAGDAARGEDGPDHADDRPGTEAGEGPGDPGVPGAGGEARRRRRRRRRRGGGEGPAEAGPPAGGDA
jgi:cell fate regulator YaaT (PSP1 superfamily)